MRSERIGIFNREFYSAVLVSFLVFLTAALTPLIGPLVDVFIPLPVFYYCSRLGRSRGIAVFCLSLFAVMAVAVLSSADAGVSALVVFGSFGLVLSELFKKTLSIEKTVLYSALSIVILGFFFFLANLLVTGEDPMRAIQSYIHQGVEETISVYAQLGVSADRIDEFRKTAPLIVRTILGLFPALMIIGALSFAIVNVLMGRALFQRAGIPGPDFGNLTLWKLPDPMVWFVIAAGGLVLAPWGEIRLVGLNLLIVFLFVYLFQGFAIIHYFFQKKNVPVFLRTIAYCIIFVQNVLFLVVITIGFADIWVNFRKRNPPAVNSVEQS